MSDALIYVLAALGIAILGVGSWWLSKSAWEPRPEDECVGPDVPQTLDEFRRRAVTRERIP